MSAAATRRSYGSLEVVIHPDLDDLADAACAEAVAAIAADFARRGEAAIVLATGNSQLGFLERLCAADLDWSRISILHLDEYVGIDADHPASFRRYLREHVVDKVAPKAFYGLGGDAADLSAECARYRALLKACDPQLCVMGVGENGHLAFNDPPADFSTTAVVHEVELDRACRLQQVGEGHFPDFDSVPTRALSLTVPAMLSMPHLVAIAPEQRKAQVIATALDGPISPDCPASALRQAAGAVLHLDEASASRLA
ncbi:MAG: glucosamine-6-phosphate deaminase [Actinomycetota bacterium]|nr:glucosamine-6-phosphate deaminase [Actinomycetota bacterium]